jgi:hypothetical protein
LLHETISADKGIAGIYRQCFPVAAENGLTKIQGFWDALQKTSGTYTRLVGHTQEEFCDTPDNFQEIPYKTSGTTL